MALLNQNSAIQSVLTESAPLPRTRMFVYSAQTGNLAPLYADAHLTAMQANPMRANSEGRFDLCHVSNGIYTVEIRSDSNERVFLLQNMAVRDMTSFGIVGGFRDVRTLLNDRILSYEAGPGRIQISPGETLQVPHEGFSYEIAEAEAEDSHVQTSGGIRLYVKPREGEYSDRQFVPAADGATDDTAIYRLIAEVLSPGQTLRLSGAGERIISGTVLFPQDDITVLCDRGVIFKQAPGTEGMDRMMEFSGDRVMIRGGEWNGNLVGNSGETYGAYTGRGELLKLSGDHIETEGVVIRDVQDAPFAAGIYVSGFHARLRNTTTYNTGRHAIRDGGDDTVIDGLRAFGMFENQAGLPAAQRSGSKAIAKDVTPSGSPFSLVTYRNIFCESRQDGGDYWCNSILIDHNGVQGEEAIIENVRVNFPNLASYAANVIKFVYVKDVTLRGFRGTHGSGSTFTLRIQENVENVMIDDCVLPGSIQMDATVPCKMTIRGRSTLCNEIPDIPIQDFEGALVVEDGCAFRNVTTRVLQFSGDAYDSTASFGRVHLHAAPGNTPTLVTLPGFTGTAPRALAGSVVVRKPISVSGPFRTLEAEGRWVAGNEDQEVTVAQGGDRVFLATSSTFPPRYGDGWKRGDIVRRRNIVAGQGQAEYWCVTAGSAVGAAWSGATTYAVGNRVHNGGQVYVCSAAGTSAVSGGPSGTGTGLADGSASWNHVDTLAVFKAVGTIAT